MESGRIHLPPIQDMLCWPLSFPLSPEKGNNKTDKALILAPRYLMISII